MNAQPIWERLGHGEIVQLSAAEWQELAPLVEVVEEHDTHMSGQLLIVRGPSGLAAVEEPGPDERVVRALADEDAVRAFVADRLDTYERMWDGCGCKVDYYG